MKRKKKRSISLSLRQRLAALTIVFKVAALTAALAVLSLNIPCFDFFLRCASVLCALRIVTSGDNPDYKIPWLLLVMIAPGVGFMLYLMLYSRILPIKYLRRLKRLLPNADFYLDDSESFFALSKQDATAAAQARLLCSCSASHLYSGAGIRYFPSGGEMLDELLLDISHARKFIYLEYYIIKNGVFLDRLTCALAERAAVGVDVRILYDDIGTDVFVSRKFASDMTRLKISAVAFSRLSPCLDSGFNNRNHRKIAVIDGNIAYTGGINIGDEYIGMGSDLGRWKDSAVRLEGNCVREFLRLFVLDYGLNVNNDVLYSDKTQKETQVFGARSRFARLKITRMPENFCIPFGDGPRPLYTSRVSKSLILSMLGSATQSVYITTPYLVIDTELINALEACCARGVDVRIILPEIPDKRSVNLIGEGIAARLIRAGVRVYLYTDGFIHAKTYTVDGKYTLLGSINFDNRSLAHNFECGVWIYSTGVAELVKSDFECTLNESKQIFEVFKRDRFYRKILRLILSVFAPLF